MAINPYVPATLVGNGVQTDFTFTFPYLNALHVKATINAVPTTAFTFFSINVLRFTVAPANGAAVVIFRETPANTLSTVIQAGGPLPVDGLNNNFLQSLYYNQETQFDSANQSTAGLQAQITTANNNANAAVVTANAASATASGLAGSIATANSNASTALSATTTLNARQMSAGAGLSGGGTLAADRTFSLAQPFTERSPQTLSGSAIEFASIPSWVRSISVAFFDASMSTVGNILIQAGAGSYGGTTYVGHTTLVFGTALTHVAWGSGINLDNGNATDLSTGTINLRRSSGSRWIVDGAWNTPNIGNANHFTAGSLLVAGTLDRLQLFPSAGSLDGGLATLYYQ